MARLLSECDADSRTIPTLRQDLVPPSLRTRLRRMACLSRRRFFRLREKSERRFRPRLLRLSAPERFSLGAFALAVLARSTAWFVVTLSRVDGSRARRFGVKLGRSSREGRYVIPADSTDRSKSGVPLAGTEPHFCFCGSLQDAVGVIETGCAILRVFLPSTNGTEKD